jgi:hypothetical protein
MDINHIRHITIHRRNLLPPALGHFVVLVIARNHKRASL